MPPDTEPFGLPPRDAIRYFRRRRVRPLPSWSWLELQREAHAKMFTVVKSAGFDILGDVADAMDRAQAQGHPRAVSGGPRAPLAEEGLVGTADRRRARVETRPRGGDAGDPGPCLRPREAAGRQARREASPRTEKVGLSPTSLPT